MDYWARDDTKNLLLVVLGVRVYPGSLRAIVHTLLERASDHLIPD